MAEEFTALGTALIMMVVDFSRMAFEFKKFLGLDSTQTFPALNIAENKLCYADSRFEFSVIADCDWKYKDSVQAVYKHSDNRHEISIKESVYDLALGGDINALYSIAHEVSHWGIINFFKFDFGLSEFNKLNAMSQSFLVGIHENMANLLTVLLVCGEEELEKAKSARELSLSSCMDEAQLSLALFYFKNRTILAQNFIKNIAPKIWEQNQIQRRLKNA